ncbi:MAG: GntR family transcriptional regulator [Firmicutes bacterium HGW-Firmicutes-7]|nr:MAG: GntR family transcriptional regulator [Firmicutes bacterium HGW-Firmicutes-7]
MLNRKDPIPLYVQLYRRLKQDIIKGTYSNGSMIPSEAQLIKQYNVTRTTIRKAVSTLAQEGLVETIHGKGTVVSLRELDYNVWNFGSFTDYLRMYNETPKSLVIENKVVVHDEKKYFKLLRGRGINKNGEIVYLTLDNSLIPYDLFPGIEKYDFSVESFYNIMKTVYNIKPDHVNIRIFPVIASGLAQELFKINETTPILRVEGTLYSKDSIELEKISLTYSPNINFNIVSSVGDRTQY